MHLAWPLVLGARRGPRRPESEPAQCLQNRLQSVLACLCASHALQSALKALLSLLGL
jgi:hypothetical protein